MSSLTSINPEARLATPSGDDLGDLIDRMETSKIASKEAIPDGEVGIGGPDRYIKHPLQNAWTLWFFKNDKSRTWEENQRPIITVTTVEDFWSLYNHIEEASKLQIGCDYSLFKKVKTESDVF